MCDYSLHHVASRPARVGDKLVSTSFVNSGTRGFAAVGEPNVAVCLLPGTELAFEEWGAPKVAPTYNARRHYAVAKRGNPHPDPVHFDCPGGRETSSPRADRTSLPGPVFLLRCAFRVTVAEPLPVLSFCRAGWPLDSLR
jgi:hypothetical protein